MNKVTRILSSEDTISEFDNNVNIAISSVGDQMYYSQKPKQKKKKPLHVRNRKKVSVIKTADFFLPTSEK